ncbi:hypothetical protein [Pseudobutyrivibrio xylanivorans]|uniref:Uncharacterized protein n=1 Tax=Pseudobutyrivibrio xylanivorans TaxID=185007 RepID=A0A5P6VRZ6_PSEXY|nr:hypothetical protein [Pseudobutyrivibrio xylanivorans]QFJ53611.1 hypothetical protein FXF36_01370 [Pseudobutyrivibrio xylanivorans]
MKGMKRFLGCILSMVFVFALTWGNVVTADAAYTYTVNIVIGDNEDASFDESALQFTKTENEPEIKTEVRKRTNKAGEKVDFKLIISGLNYGDKITFDAAKLIKIKGDGNSKYYVKGLRVAGADDLYKPEGSNSTTAISINVTGDETYVAAYGVGSVISYKVQYLDEKGNTLYPEETLYGAKGEEAVVPARHIIDYTPDATEKTEKIADNTVIKFTYNKLPATITYETIEETTTVYVQGEPTYTYEYEYLDGGTQLTSTTTQRPQVVNNRRETTTNVAANTTENVTIEEEETPLAGDTTTIEDDETPKSGGDTITIGDEETPLAGEEPTTIPDEEVPESLESEHLMRTVIVTIVILVVCIIAFSIAMYIVNKKKKTTFALPPKNDEKR